MHTASNHTEAISHVEEDLPSPSKLQHELNMLVAKRAGVGEIQSFLEESRRKALETCHGDEARKGRLNGAFFYLWGSVPFWRNDQNGEGAVVLNEKHPVPEQLFI